MGISCYIRKILRGFSDFPMLQLVGMFLCINYDPKKRKWRLKTESLNSFLIRVLFVQLQQFNPYQISYYHEMKKEKDSKSLYAMSMAKTLSLHIMLVEMRKNMQSHKITSFLSHLLMDRWTSKTHY